MKEKKFIGINKEGQKIEFSVVATFNLNGRNYLFYTDMINMYTGYYEAKKVKNITNSEEYNLLMSIYNQLKIKEFEHEFYDYGYTFYNGKNYKMIFDQYDRKRYFYELINGKYKEVEGETLKYFNNKFNSDITSLADSSENTYYKEFNNKFRRIKIEKSLIIVLAKNYQLKELIKDNITFVKEISLFHEIENPNQIKEMLNQNEIMPLEDKALYLSLDELYNDNYQYMNLDNLKDLKVIYEPNNNIDEPINGQYYPKEKEIKIYDKEKLDKNNIHTNIHEYIHALSNKGLAYDNPDGVALTEGITELITSEYLATINNEKYTGSYQKQQVYAKMLCEIVGTDTVLNAFFKHDYNILIDELNKYTKNELASNNLIRLINDEAKYEKELGKKAYQKEMTNENINFKVIQKQIDRIYSVAFEKSKGYPLEEDKLMCSYLDQIRKGNRAEYEFYKDGNTYYTDVKKYYINNKLKSNLAMITYYYSPGLAIRSNKQNFKIQPNGKYQYVLSNGEIVYYDQIPDYVLTNSMNRIITEETRIKNSKNR